MLLGQVVHPWLLPQSRDQSGWFPLPLHQLGAHLEKNVAGSSQCGLTKGQTCQANPLAFGGDSMGEGRAGNVIYLEFGKDDTVSHNSLDGEQPDG